MKWVLVAAFAVSLVGISIFLWATGAGEAMAGDVEWEDDGWPRTGS